MPLPLRSRDEMHLALGVIHPLFLSYAAMKSAVLLGAVLLTTGCSMGGAGNEQPVSMTFRDGEFVMHWCGEPTEELKYLEITYAEYSPSRSDRVAFRGEGAFVLRAGDEFSTSVPPAEVVPLESRPLPADGDNRVTVFVESGSDADNLDGVSAILRAGSPRDLEGRWLYPSGRIHDEPCEMRGAASE